MPNRILREGIITSERVDSLSEGAELFYRRLMSLVDDYGRYTAHPSLLLAALYPLRLDRVTVTQIEQYLLDVAQVGLIVTYSVKGKRYLQMVDFRQQLRTKKPQWPAPDCPPADDLHSRCIADDVQMPSTCAADDTRLHSTCAASASFESESEERELSSGKSIYTQQYKHASEERARAFINPVAIALSKTADETTALYEQFIGVFLAAGVELSETDLMYAARGNGAKVGFLNFEPEEQRVIVAYAERKARHTEARFMGLPVNFLDKREWTRKGIQRAMPPPKVAEEEARIEARARRLDELDRRAAAGGRS